MKWLMFVLAAICFFLAGCKWQLNTTALKTDINWWGFGVMFLVLGERVV